jgi:hypothetical protein
MLNQSRINYVPFYNSVRNRRQNTDFNTSTVVFCLFVVTRTCLAKRCPAMDYSGFHAFWHNRHGKLLSEALPHNELFRLSCFLTLVTGTCLAKRCPAMDYSAFHAFWHTRCHGNLLSESVAQRWTIPPLMLSDTLVTGTCLAKRCLTMDYSGFHAFWHTRCHGNLLSETLPNNGLFRLSCFLKLVVTVNLLSEALPSDGLFRL